MLQSMGSQRVGHDWVTEQHKRFETINYCAFRVILKSKLDKDLRGKV